MDDFVFPLLLALDVQSLTMSLVNIASPRGGEGALAGHSFGNLFITAMAEITGDFEHAIRESGRVLAVRGQIVPATLRDVGVKPEQLDAIAAGSMHDRWVHTNPRKIDGPQAVRALLDAAW